jgi:hypothetical protein
MEERTKFSKNELLEMASLEVRGGVGATSPWEQGFCTNVTLGCGTNGDQGICTNTVIGCGSKVVKD